MKLYSQLSGLRFLTSYSAKFLFIAFLGIHIPLLGLTAFLIINSLYDEGTLKIVGLVLLLTLIATGITLFLLDGLTAPIRTAQQALQGYLGQGKKPQLPTGYSDEVGQLLRELQNTLEALDGAIQEKKDLIGMLSHDLRSPANSIFSLASLIRQEPDRKIIDFYCDQVSRLSTSQLDLMESMLLVLRNEHAQLSHADLSQVSLKNIAEKAISMVSVNLQNKNLTVQHQIPETAQVEVEPVSFCRVLVNLLDNATKFSYPGGSISLLYSTEEGLVRLSVCDQGLGFHPTDAEMLFQRFTPLGKPGTKGEPTHGIGLYLCRQIVQRHHGQLIAHSPGPGQGATFTVIIPALRTQPLAMS